MMGTTPAQRQVLAILARLQAQGDYGPSLREIREIMGVASKSSVHALIEALIERGLITRLRYRSRSIRVRPEALARYGAPIEIAGAAYRYIPATRLGANSKRNP